MPNIQVINKKGGIPPELDRYAVNIDRHTILGNPFRIGEKYTREQSVTAYKRWVWNMFNHNRKIYNEVMHLVNRAIKDETLVLCCWCKPLACHGDVLKALIEHLIERDEYV